MVLAQAWESLIDAVNYLHTLDGVHVFHVRLRLCHFHSALKPRVGLAARHYLALPKQVKLSVRHTPSKHNIIGHGVVM
jgi:hypothetical protein